MKCKFILCLAVLLSGGLFTFAEAARRNTIPYQPQRTQSSHALEFDSIQMIDRHTGWAQNAGAVFLTNDWVFKDKSISRTTDGGKSWTQVLCGSAANTGNISAFFHDSKRAWIAAADESTNVTILRTTDGGGSWIRSELRQSHIIQDSCLSFPTAREGWLMLIPERGMNSSPGDLYQTGDGGAHWRQVNTTDAKPGEKYIWEQATEAGFEDPHPFLVCGGAIAFRNASTGWVWGSLATTTPGFLCITRDGGLIWQVQNLPLPSSLQDGRMLPIGLPHFFQLGGKDGIIAAEFRPTDNGSTNYWTGFYRTHDGGLSWKPTASIKSSRVSDFVSAKKGWLWSAELHSTGSTTPVIGTLYRTSDGGTSWRVVKAKKSLDEYLTHGEDIVRLDFVDDEYGWAVARDDHNLSQLLQTVDGGKTWNNVQMRVHE